MRKETKNTYLLDPESEGEMIRLARQGRLLTQGVGLLPPNVNPLQLPSVVGEVRAPSVLDIGCATGEWGLGLAATYRHLQIVGIDVSNLMIAYACSQAENQELPNTHFEIGNILNSLHFPDGSFDLINIRVAVGFIPRDHWEEVFRECWRLLKPQGILISTEGEAGVTTYKNPATAQINRWLVEALWVSGLGFWDGIGAAHGIHAMQPTFFRRVGFTNLEFFPHILYASYGAPQYQGWLDHLKITVQSIEPLVCNALKVTKEEFSTKLQESLIEARQDAYHVYTTFLTITGQKMPEI